MKPEAKMGWRMYSEPRPSLVQHWMPEAQAMAHTMRHDCACKPRLQGEPFLDPPYTIVHHNELGLA